MEEKASEKQSHADSETVGETWMSSEKEPHSQEGVESAGVTTEVVKGKKCSKKDVQEREKSK